MRLRTWSNDTSTPKGRTGSGWPTSPPFPRGQALRADLGGVRVPGRGARRVQPAHRGLVDGRPSSYRTGPRSAEHGRQPAPARGGDPSLRPRLTIPLGGVRQTLPGDGGASLDRLRGRLHSVVFPACRGPVSQTMRNSAKGVVLPRSSRMEQDRRFPPAGRPERLSDIVENGLCIGCGLCQAVAGQDRIEFVITPEGRERPVERKKIPPDAWRRILGTCPGVRVEGATPGLSGQGAKTDRAWGPYHRVCLGHAADPEVRFRAASGGVLTALAAWLVEHASSQVRRLGRSEVFVSRSKRHTSRASNTARTARTRAIRVRFELGDGPEVIRHQPPRGSS